jgi:hypothetical protein
MLSAGLDFHKRYSQVEVLDEDGLRRAPARLGNEFEEVRNHLSNKKRRRSASR